MYKYILLLITTLLCLPSHLTAVEKGGINMPDTLQLTDQTLILNGAGVRSKFFIDLYVVGLYLSQPSQDPAAILAADEPMALRLHIVSSKITTEKMIKSIRKGFKNSMQGDTTAIDKTIEKFIAAINKPIQKGDIFEFIYSKGMGVQVLKNDQEQVYLSAPKFKGALFGIWLSKQPVQKKLKNNLLNN